MESSGEVPTGRSVVGVRFRRRDTRGSGPWASGFEGTATLVVDGAEQGSVDVPFVMHIISSLGPSVGYDHGSPVSDRYGDALPFEGHLERVDIQLVSERDAGAAAAGERSGMSRQ